MNEQVIELWPPWVKRLFVAIGVFIPTAVFVFNVGTWSHGVFVDLTDRISKLDVAVTANTHHRTIHDEQAKHWISQVIRNRDDVRQLERDVVELRSLSQAREDAFSGATGRAFQDRLERLEADRDQ